MRRLNINNQKLAVALRRMAPQTGSIICQGCGYEHNCYLHGCAVLRAAADRLIEMSAPPPNPPLTLEELREMDGEPVWLFPVGCWVLVTQNPITSLFTFSDGNQCVAEDWLTNVGKAYRRKPEEGTNHG